MTFCFRYIDHLPGVPDDLIGDMSSFNDDDLQDTNYRKNRTILYQRWNTGSKLEQWVRDNICDDYLSLGIQVHKRTEDVDRHAPHTDRTRPWVLMYVFDTGGEDVVTTWYKEKGQSLVRGLGISSKDLPNEIEHVESVKIEKNRWCLLNSSIIHGVKGINDIRISLAIAIDHDDPFTVIKQQ